MRARGRCSPTVDRIRAMDTSIHAWVQVLPQRPTGAGPLDEIPFGAKDIMETRGLSTEYGSAIYKGRIGTEDAAIVRDLRARGAVLMGKTQTTAFAYREPAPTRQPAEPRAHARRQLQRFGGGGRRGHGAVCARHADDGIGAAAGVVLRRDRVQGRRYGLVSLDGVLPFAKSLDTLGFFTHTPGRHARAVGSDGTLRRPAGGRRRSARRIRSRRSRRR